MIRLPQCLGSKRGPNQTWKGSLTDGPAEVLHQDLSFLDLGGVNFTAHHRAERHLVSQLLGHSQCKSRLQEEPDKSTTPDDKSLGVMGPSYLPSSRRSSQ